jgi:hypothetical protein
MSAPRKPVGGVETISTFDIRVDSPEGSKGRRTITVTKSKLRDLPQATPEDRSRRAVVLWYCQEHLTPLINVLAAGEATAEAQTLAADLLKRATSKTLPAMSNDVNRHREMIATYLMALHVGYGKMEAMKLVEQTFALSRQAVQKVIYRKAALVEQMQQAMYPPGGIPTT